MTGMGPTLPTEEHFNKGQWGWDGSVWRKLGMVWGYEDTLAVVKSELSAAAGQNVLDTAAFAAGFVYVVQAIVGIDINSNPSQIRLLAVSSGNFVPLLQTATPGADTPVLWTGHMTLKEGDYIRVRFQGCTLNDDLYVYVLGYKMAVT